MILFESAFVKAQWSGDKGNSTYDWEKVNAEATERPASRKFYTRLTDTTKYT
jgi:hypothetical protein